MFVWIGNRCEAGINEIPAFSLNPQTAGQSVLRGHVDIYERKLELLEEVTLPRSGDKRVVTTWFLWFYGVDPAIEIRKVTLDDLQSDLDRMLKVVFIDQYKFLNPEQMQGKH